jgi:hypothetical protein
LQKPNNTPAKCALCDGPHPANYKGCKFYQSLFKPDNTNNRLNLQRTRTVNINNFTERQDLPAAVKTTHSNASYASVTRGIPNSSPQADMSTITLNKFLEELKNMFNQLIQQNTMVLNMLSTLLTKLHNDQFKKIAVWNANGLLQHKYYIKIFLDHSAVDILLLSETHFTERSYFKIPHYNAYFTNHPDSTAHACAGIIIKNTIQHYELPKFEENFLQATAIKVKMQTYDLTIAAVYCPPRHNIKEENFLEFFQTLGNKFIAGGDFDSKNTLWDSRLTTTRGRALSK